MKKFMLITLLVAWGILSFAQGIYNNGAHIVSTSGSYWVVDNGGFTLTSTNISNLAKFANLKIMDDASLTLDATSAPSYLTVSGDLTVASGGSLNVGSTANGTSSLIIEGTSNGNVSVQRYIAAASWTNWNDGWHQVSSPVADYDITTSNFTVTPANEYDFFAWSEIYNLWVNFKDGSNPAFTDADVNGSDDFELGHGYMVAYKNAAIKSFTGEINNANVSISNLDITGSTDYYSWHLLGNPFTSALTWFTDWTTSNIAGTAKIWNEANQSYSTISAGDPIPPTNGFMIQVTADNASLTIPVSKCIHNSQAFYKNSDYPIIKLKACNLDNTSAQESEIRFNPQSTTEWDWEFDSDFLSGYAPLFYSNIDDRPMAVNSMPEYSENTVVPFTFIKNEGLNFSIEMDEITGMDKDVWLMDKKLNNEQNLSLNPVYVFTSLEGDNAERFEIRFKAVGIEEDIVKSYIQCWAKDNNLYIINPESKTGKIQVFTVLGQAVLNTKLTCDAKQEITLHVPSGFYLVTILSENYMTSRKVYIENE